MTSSTPEMTLPREMNLHAISVGGMQGTLYGVHCQLSEFETRTQHTAIPGSTAAENPNGTRLDSHTAHTNGTEQMPDIRALWNRSARPHDPHC